MTIRELRTQQKLSQAEFARRIGVSQVTVSMIETGRIKVSPKVAAAVMKACGVDVGDEGSGKPAVKKPARKGPAAKKTAEKKASKPAAKETPAGAKMKVTKVGKTSGRKAELYIQSPCGGEITPEQVLARIPADADACYVRVDQNTIWWVRGNECGTVMIW